MRNVRLYFIFFFILLFSSSIVSAGFWDWITGKATTLSYTTTLSYVCTGGNQLIGDVNNDGVINTIDRTIITKVYQKTISTDNQDICCGDVNNDNKIDINDFLKVSNYILYQTKCFPRGYSCSLKENCADNRDNDCDKLIDGNDNDCVKETIVAQTTVTGNPVICDSYGDLNDDGYVTSEDVTLISKCILELPECTSEQRLRADVNNDRTVDMGDVVTIGNYIAGVINTFPACSKTSPCDSYGDLNNNGYVNLRDAELIAKCILGLPECTAEQKSRADVNNDGTVNMGDVILLESFVSGTTATFPICTKSITVISPNGGETWKIGRTYIIQWKNPNLISSLNIDLYKGNIFFGGIGGVAVSENAPAPTSYRWTIPTILNGANLISGSDYKIRIEANNNAAIYDDSDNYFSIVSSTTTCTDSDGGKNFYVKGQAKTGTMDYIYDKCGSSGKLEELYCDVDGRLNNYIYECPYGCLDGACLTKQISPKIQNLGTYCKDGTVTFVIKNSGTTDISVEMKPITKECTGIMEVPVTIEAGSYASFYVSGCASGKVHTYQFIGPSNNITAAAYCYSVKAKSSYTLTFYKEWNLF